MGVTIGGGKNTHLLVIMRVRLSQKIGLLDLTNRTRFKKGNGLKQRTKSMHDYCGIRLMLHTPSYYYAHTNVDLLGVWYVPVPRVDGWLKMSHVFLDSFVFSFLFRTGPICVIKRGSESTFLLKRIKQPWSQGRPLLAPAGPLLGHRSSSLPRPSAAP